MDRATEDHINNRIAALEMKVKDLEDKLADRKLGQKLAAEESDIYETAWEQENGKLKELLKEVITFIEATANSVPFPFEDDCEKPLLKRLKDAVLQKP